MKVQGKITNNHELKINGGREFFRSKLIELAPGEVDIIIRPYKKDVTPKQRGYYFKVVVPHVLEGLRGNGYKEVCTPDDAHRVITNLFFRKIITSDRNDTLEMIESIKGFSTVEFYERVEMIRTWSEDYLGTFIPEPGSQAAINFRTH